VQQITWTKSTRSFSNSNRVGVAQLGAARPAYVTANHPTAPCSSSPPASGTPSPQACATANSTTPARH